MVVACVPGGQYDEYGTGPHPYEYHGATRRRELAGGDVRQGMLCYHYDETDPKFTTPYEWEYCEGMEVGQTYEVHWPHSAAGACGTKWQYQSKFYDGVFCNMEAVMGVLTNADTTDAAAGYGDGVGTGPMNIPSAIGVQGQVFTIVNDEHYAKDLTMAGAIMGGEYWQDVARYTGSTTGTSRDNVECSNYAPITWQVDRKCHMISASTFDKMCADMKAQRDDMSGDLHAHGARELVTTNLVANNHAEHSNPLFRE